jgi:hypothetical protein
MSLSIVLSQAIARGHLQMLKEEEQLEEIDVQPLDPSTRRKVCALSIIEVNWFLKI